MPSNENLGNWVSFSPERQAKSKRKILFVMAVPYLRAIYKCYIHINICILYGINKSTYIYILYNMPHKMLCINQHSLISPFKNLNFVRVTVGKHNW